MITQRDFMDNKATSWKQRFPDFYDTAQFLVCLCVNVQPFVPLTRNSIRTS